MYSHSQWFRITMMNNDFFPHLFHQFFFHLVFSSCKLYMKSFLLLFRSIYHLLIHLQACGGTLHTFCSSWRDFQYSNFGFFFFFILFSNHFRHRSHAMCNIRFQFFFLCASCSSPDSTLIAHYIWKNSINIMQKNRICQEVWVNTKYIIIYNLWDKNRVTTVFFFFRLNSFVHVRQTTT